MALEDKPRLSDKTRNMLSIVIVAFGPPSELEAALAAIGGGAHKTVVVDNSTSVATRQVVVAAGGTYVDPGTNVGFARAVNMGLSRLDLTNTDVLLLNPDARIEGPAIDNLHRALLDEPDVACVAPAQRSPGSGHALEAVWPWDSPASAWADALGLRRDSRHRGLPRAGEDPVGFLSGAVLLLRGRALLDVGMFDERFFLYAEDKDWQRRARDRGWQLRHVPQVIATHKMGGTDTDAVKVQLRLHAATEQYVRKWYGALGWASYRAAWVVGYSARALYYGLTPKKRSLGRRMTRLVRLYAIGPARCARRAGVLPGSPL
ncbi:MAG: glycosyltransferase [Acidimicrobiales bacterium]